MFTLFRRPPVQKGPDFSDITSKAKAETRVQHGELEKMLLLPTEFGGTVDPRNVVYVPVSFVAIKATIDMNIIKLLIEDGTTTEYQATSEYQGRSFVLVAIKIKASNPCSFTTEIKIWGKALAWKGDA